MLGLHYLYVRIMDIKIRHIQKKCLIIIIYKDKLDVLGEVYKSPLNNRIDFDYSLYVDPNESLVP